MTQPRRNWQPAQPTPADQLTAALVALAAVAPPIDVARSVAGISDAVTRSRVLQAFAREHGKALSVVLQRDVWALIQGVRPPGGGW